MSGTDTSTVRLATRGSELALRQTGQLAERLRDHRMDVEILEVETTGDRIEDELIENLGTTGAFVRSLDRHVLNGSADFAIHSMKDMPTESPDELSVVAVPKRGAPEDVLVTPNGTMLDELPTGARVGTASVRRQAQLLAARPDLQVKPLRGNVDTRIEKLLAPNLQAEHQRRLDDDDADAEAWFEELSALERQALGRSVDTRYDAIVLAAAGLERSGLIHAVPTHRLPPTEFVPAPAQGALAVVGRDGTLGDKIRSHVELPRTRVECAVERTVLAGIGGGCIAPIGAYARVQGAVVTVTVRVLSGDGTETVATTRELPVVRPVKAAATLAEDLVHRGARGLIDDASAEASDQAPRGNGP